jgi:PTH1 family peptidyl-tRNA hydrolase
MRSAVRLLGGQDFPRIRIGIGPKPPETDLTDFVLGQIPPESAALMNEAFERCCEGVRLTLERDIQFAMNRINPHRLPEQSTPQAPAASIRPKEGDV